MGAGADRCTAPSGVGVQAGKGLGHPALMKQGAKLRPSRAEIDALGYQDSAVHVHDLAAAAPATC